MSLQAKKELQPKLLAKDLAKNVYAFDSQLNSVRATGCLLRVKSTSHPIFLSITNNIMMTSSHGNIFRVTSHLCSEFTGRRWFPRAKASDAEFAVFIDLVWIDGRVNNRQSGDLRRYRTQYDVTVMSWHFFLQGNKEFTNGTWNNSVSQRAFFTVPTSWPWKIEFSANPEHMDSLTFLHPSKSLLHIHHCCRHKQRWGPG